MSIYDNQKRIFSLSNIITAILVLFTIAMLVVPNFKAGVLKALMDAGLFQPGTRAKQEAAATVPRNWQVQFSNNAGIVAGSHMRGKLVFINVWATWCPPCIAEMPAINRLYKKYQNNPDIIFLMVDADSDPEKSTAFMNSRKLDLPVYVSNGPMPKEWFEGSLPTTIVLDKRGRIAYRHEGLANYDSEKFQQFLEELMKEPF